MIDWTLTKYCCVRVFRQRTSSLSKAIDIVDKGARLSELMVTMLNIALDGGKWS